MADGIRIQRLSETGVTPGDLAQLFNITFSEYEGVLRPTPEVMDWYLRRPGMGAEHAFVAMAGRFLVGATYVTAAPVVLGGGSLRCGIVDSVMTHPDWRGRGIATSLMRHAIAWMRDAGLSAGFLYTEPGSDGYRIYARLGFRERARVYYHYSEETPPLPADPGLREAAPDEGERIRGLLNAWLRARDGFVPVDEALWRWRRTERPAAVPCSVYVLEEGGEPIGTGAICCGRVFVSGQAVDLAILTDVAAASPGVEERTARALLARVSPDHAAGMLAGSLDPVLPALGQRLGMDRFDEVAMVLPLDAAGEAALQHPACGWYTLAESLVGV